MKSRGPMKSLEPMKSHGLLALCLAVAFSLASESAAAWGNTGHRVTGEIAMQHLSEDARTAIENILGVEDLAEASTWADFMRSSSDVFWTDFASPFHYVTIPVGKGYREVGAPPEGDAITAMGTFTKTLRSEAATLGEKQLALRFLVHIIGDLHQPLHAGNGTDRGGNDYDVTFFGTATNLHTVWDTAIIEHEGLSFSELATWLNRRITQEQITEWSQIDPTVWVGEGTAIRDRIYPDGDRELRWRYVFEHRGTVHLRLSQAGVRMALYLNALFAR